MKKTYNKPAPDQIADLADRGEDISKYFTNKGKMKYPTQRVNVDFTVEMLNELDMIASELNISRQAVIKTYLRQAQPGRRSQIQTAAPRFSAVSLRANPEVLLDTPTLPLVGRVILRAGDGTSRFRGCGRRERRCDAQPS